MPIQFEYLRLRVESLYALIAQPIELELIVTENSVLLAGGGYRNAVTGVLHTLIPDWRAIVRLSGGALPLTPGVYSLLFQDHLLFAWRDRQSFPIADGPVVMEVWEWPPATDAAFAETVTGLQPT